MVPCTVNLRRASGANTGGWVTRRSVAGPRWLDRWIHPRGRRLVGDQVPVGAGLAADLVPAAWDPPGGGAREADRGSPRRVLDRGRRRGRDRDIGVPGRGPGLHPVPALDLHALLHPPRCLLAVVTARAQPLPVVQAGHTTIGVRGHVVQVPHGGVAPRHGADALLAGTQQRAQPRREEPRGRGRGQQPAPRRDVDAAQPRAARIDPTRDHVPCDRGGHHTRTTGRALHHDRGVVPTGQQGPVRDQQVHRHRHLRGLTRPTTGNPLDQGVGHDLTHPAGLTGTRTTGTRTAGRSGRPSLPGRLDRLGVRLELGIRLHTLHHRHQRSQVHHQIRSRAQRHPPLTHGLRVALEAGVHVPPGRQLLDPRDQPARAQTRQGFQAIRAAQLLVDQAPVLRGQVRRLPHQQTGPPRRQDPGLQGGEGVRHEGHPHP